MPLAVVAYPTLSDDDRRWIEAIRARHDPLASRIAAHFTLVFPAEPAEAPLVAHVRDVVQFRGPVSAVLRRAAAFPEAAGSGSQVFLLAEEGHREPLAVHDTLYTGLLTAHREEIAFVPHLTVGVHQQAGECERIANQLNAEGRLARAWINSVDVVEVGNSMVRTPANIPLGVGGGEPSTPPVDDNEPHVR